MVKDMAKVTINH